MEQLTVLLDLKQKQANISEARSSRLQAEQANEQANETARQGTIIMLVSALIQANDWWLTSNIVHYRHDSLRKTHLPPR